MNGSPANSRERYEVIAWDGCGEWWPIDKDTRKEARTLKRWASPGIHDGVIAGIKIWDRKRREFITLVRK